jgi:uncharacterized protein (TIGR00255 family)
MTAFASQTGSLGSSSWVWDMRGVNGRGLDLRLRLPDGMAEVEAALRAAMTARLARGNVSVSLRLLQDDSAAGLHLDAAHLERVLGALYTIGKRAASHGIDLAPPSAVDILGQRGVMLHGTGPAAQGQTSPDERLPAALIADFGPLLDAFCAMRAREGAALAAILRDQIDSIAQLTDAAATAAEARRNDARASLTAALRRVVEDISEIDEARIAQELALLAVKSDITEELDRLRAHVAAARDLLNTGGPQGRRLDFLSQEFNREANTLCSKAGSTALTAIGLDLKTAIDQMREQIQNVE